MSSLSAYMTLVSQVNLLKKQLSDYEEHPFYRQAASAREMLDGRKASAKTPKDREFEYAFFVPSSCSIEGAPFESLWAAEFPEFVRVVAFKDGIYRIEFKW